MYKIRPIGRDEEGHPQVGWGCIIAACQGARYAVLHAESIIYYIDFEVEVTDEWESSRDMPGGWDYEMSNLRAWYRCPQRVRGPLPRELELSVHQYIEDNPEEFLGQEVRC